MIFQSKNIIQNYKYLFKTNFYIRKIQLFYIIVISFFVLFFSLAVIYSAIPFLDLMISDDFDSYQNFSKKLFLFIRKFNIEPSFAFASSIFLSTVILKAFFDVFYQYYVFKLQFKYMEKESYNLNKTIFSMDQSFFFKFSSSKILNLFTKELERSSDVISAFFLFFISLLQFIIFITIPIFLNTKLTLIFFLILSIGLIPFIFINYISLREGFKSTIYANDLLKTLNNNFLYNKFISIHGIIKKVNILYNNSFKPFANNKIKLTVLNSLIRSYLQPLGILAIIISLSFLSLGTTQNLSVIGTILWSLTRTFGPLNAMMGSINLINSQISAFKNLYQTRYEFDHLKNKNGENIISEINKITLSDVNFEYENNKIYKNLNLTINNGDKVALIGDTGSGKSTLLDLITNIVKISSGKRFINDMEFEKVNFDIVRKKISYVPQSLPILDGTIKEYFNFYNETISDKKIIYYLEFMNCRSFLGNLENSFNIYLGDKGMRLSGGQKQKVILAAALSRNPQLLLLDESTNAIDKSEELNILNKILNIKDMIVIYVSHKLDNQSFFNKVLKVESCNINLVKK